MGSDSYLVRLCPDKTFCSTRDTSPLYLEATSFSPMGSEAASGALAPLLFLSLRVMLYEGIASSVFFTQSLVESPKCKDPFSNSVQAQAEVRTLGLVVIV